MVAGVGPLVGAQGGVRGVLAPNGVEGGLPRVQGVVGLVDLNAGDLDGVGFLDVDGLVEQLVEAPLVFVTGAHVEPVGVAQQGQVLLDDLLTCGEIDLDVLCLLDEPFAFALDLEQPGLDLAVVEGAVGGQVDEVLFLDVEPVDLLVELCLEQSLGGFLVADGVVHGLTDQLDELIGDAPALVVLLHGFFDAADVVVRLVAGAVVAAGAEEVVVLAAVASDAVLDEQALVDAAQPLALGAVHGALEEVVMDPAPLTGVAA